ncbi:protein regulator of cytokinesis 1-like isoform X2 [Periplaneta americana]|uniref:protein regulator of cytokinesis 1-like isoform X2 n=1 Tax=Periplaneta americana TaxID=6978 RepID=UPI0037E94890
MSRPWIRTIEDISTVAERALKELYSYWNEEELTQEERTKEIDAINDELVCFWEKKIADRKYSVLKHKIQKLRAEIEIWWEKCFLCEEEKKQFEDYRSAEYSELLYECHINELERLKRRYARDESLYLLIKKHQDMWKRIVNADKQVSNPDRFQNRGAQLLQEERDRKAAQKELPQLEEQVIKQTRMFENENGRPFLIYGERFSDMVAHQKEQHKENQKSLKSCKKKCDNCPSLSNGSTVHKSSSVYKLKRKLDTISPAASKSKLARVTSCEKLSHPSSRPLNRKIGLPVRRQLIEGTKVPAVHS